MSLALIHHSRIRPIAGFLLVVASLMLGMRHDAAAQQPAVRSIQIWSWQHGRFWYTAPDADSVRPEVDRTDSLAIIAGQDGFRQGEMLIQESAIDRLIRSVEAPPDSVTTALAIGIDRQWLQRHAQPALEFQIESWPRKWNDEQKRLFVATYTSSGNIPGSIEYYFADHRSSSHDWPEVRIELQYLDGRRTVVTSRSTAEFMVPWRIMTGTDTLISYSPEIGRSIASLLPDGFVNRRRLLGSDLPYSLSHLVFNQIEKQWAMIDTRSRIGDQLRTLEPEYTVIDGRFAYIGSADLSSRGGNDWHATLTRKDLPANLRFDITLPVENDRIRMLDSFRTRVDRYLELVRSVGWLEEYRQANPGSMIELRFVDTSSITATFIGNLKRDMKREGRSALFKRLEPLFPRSALIIVHQPGGWSRWIVLPDGRMLMAHYSGESALLWSGDQLPKDPLDGLPRGMGGGSSFHERTILIDQNGRIVGGAGKK